MLAHEIRQSLPDAVLSDFDIYIIPGSTPLFQLLIYWLF